MAALRMAWKTCILLMAFTAVSLAQYLPTPQPSYGGPNAVINVDNSAARNTIEAESGLPNAIYEEEYYEWEGYDGWYNNPAHPEWGGAGELFLLLVSFCCCYFLFYFLFFISIFLNFLVFLLVFFLFFFFLFNFF